jgi:hypothetical protein
VVKAHEGARNGIGEHEFKILYGRVKFNDLSNFENICVGQVKEWTNKPVLSEGKPQK